MSIAAPCKSCAGVRQQLRGATIRLAFASLTLVALFAIIPERASAQGADLVRSFWAPVSADKGIGLVGFRNEPGVLHRADTLVLYQSPSRRAIIAALWIRESNRGDAIRHSIAARDSLTPNLMEYGYEIAGLPIDSLSRDRKWARALLGYTTSSAFMKAWVPLDTLQVRLIEWAAYLPSKGGLFLSTPTQAEFALQPGGSTTASPFDPRFPADDHWLEVLDHRGPWLKVRFTQPADLCGAEPTPDRAAG